MYYFIAHFLRPRTYSCTTCTLYFFFVTAPHQYCAISFTSFSSMHSHYTATYSNPSPRTRTRETWKLACSWSLYRTLLFSNKLRNAEENFKSDYTFSLHDNTPTTLYRTSAQRGLKICNE